MKTPMLLRIYLGIAAAAGPVWRYALQRRIKGGKEHTTRYVEKLGTPSAKRPDKKLIWLHAVSVGEALALRSVMDDIIRERSDVSLLLTTSTLGSVEAIERIGLPPRSTHQFAPIDHKASITAFLDHWKPDLIVFSERDFWPGLIAWSADWAAKQRKAMLLVNSRMSHRSYNRRKRISSLYRALLPKFDKILLQDDASQPHLESFGVNPQNMRVVGSLKNSVEALPHNTELTRQIEQAVGSRPRWLAASTHIHECENLVGAHTLAAQTEPDLISIIAPRKPEAMEAMAQAAQDAGLITHRRSRDKLPQADTEVFIVDSLGEMGSWFRVCPITFMGFSLASVEPKLTGKNPFEALALGCAVLHGPDFSNFQESYTELVSKGATRQVQSADQLAAQIAELQSIQSRQILTRQADNFLAEKQESRRETVAAIVQHLTA